MMYDELQLPAGVALQKSLKALALTVALSLGGTMAASAATVYCPDSLGGTIPGNGPPGSTVTIDRQIMVTGALAGGECYYKEGNFQGDDFSTWLGSGYTLIDKDIAPDGGAEGSLEYTLTNAQNSAGTWEMFTNLWLTYGEIYLALHFGNGSGTPDAFIVELNPTTLSGTWELLPNSLANGLSNLYLIGRGSPYCTSTTQPGCEAKVPEPGTLALLGAGLLGIGLARRRRFWNS